ncbi:SGNH/GDSL hydrolase family protein [Sphingobacterium shayense]|uniref:SGNH/GDSL hydrolase family protein n=1 Tax=Sphingobacterium shayense TaxID=626343 RepID=UPI0015542723|nr:SGNH/GDSL hydrolase family protein [Sphingobacterium shayense]NQD72723.1 SGNH/GDSL hydrolase family protein [Sphingobacterium shayense]
MKTLICLILTFAFVSIGFSQPNFVKNLSQGISQHVVVYGTSLSSGGHGRDWMDGVKAHMDSIFGADLLSYSLAGHGGKWSVWGVKNFEDSVIAKKPDAVLIEFGINDAFLEYNTSVSLAKLNLEYMIDRIRLYNNSCDIILQVMNMAIGKSASYRPHLEQYYTMYRQTAREKKVLLIDHFPNWQKMLERGEPFFLTYVPDGIHPNALGARKVIVPEIIKCLETTTKN